jgi:hypothetical protein
MSLSLKIKYAMQVMNLSISVMWFSPINQVWPVVSMSSDLLRNLLISVLEISVQHV